MNLKIWIVLPAQNDMNDEYTFSFGKIFNCSRDGQFENERGKRIQQKIVNKKKGMNV